VGKALYTLKGSVNYFIGVITLPVIARSQVAKMDLEAIVKDAVSKALAKAGHKTNKSKTSSKKAGKPTCESVSVANKKAEKEGFPLLLTKSDSVAKKNNFKLCKSTGTFFSCKDCGVHCRTYGVLMNHYRTQKGKTVKARA
tara:strand:+ start:55 stop:477 length:423 start_codon:yes stop_codon:yes gene_type:complete